MKTLNKVSCKRNSKLHSKKKEIIIIIIENDVEFGKTRRGARNQKSHERKSKNYIIYKETKNETKIKTIYFAIGKPTRTHI